VARRHQGLKEIELALAADVLASAVERLPRPRTSRSPSSRRFASACGGKIWATTGRLILDVNVSAHRQRSRGRPACPTSPCSVRLLSGDDDTWGSSWNNPDTIPDTATALCLPQWSTGEPESSNAAMSRLSSYRTPRSSKSWRTSDQVIPGWLPDLRHSQKPGFLPRA
jgi:hypothetical protein